MLALVELVVRLLLETFKPELQRSLRRSLKRVSRWIRGRSAK